MDMIWCHPDLYEAVRRMRWGEMRRNIMFPSPKVFTSVTMR